MIRKAFVMWLKPDAQDEYKHRHDAIWPELSDVLKSHGAHNYSIFLDPTRSMLFATVEIESEELWAAVADTDVCKKWWAYMADIMPTNADKSPRQSDLREVFYLN